MKRIYAYPVTISKVYDRPSTPVFIKEYKIELVDFNDSFNVNIRTPIDQIIKKIEIRLKELIESYCEKDHELPKPTEINELEHDWIMKIRVALEQEPS